jgi:hypothetical protein
VRQGELLCGTTPKFPRMVCCEVIDLSLTVQSGAVV